MKDPQNMSLIKFIYLPVFMKNTRIVIACDKLR